MVDDDAGPVIQDVPLADILSPWLPDDQPLVARYRADMQRGDVFPPVVLVAGTRPLLRLDGCNRIAAARQLGLATIRAELRPVPATHQVPWLRLERRAFCAVEACDLPPMYVVFRFGVTLFGCADHLQPLRRLPEREIARRGFRGRGGSP